MKEPKQKVKGTVIKVLPDLTFRVKLDNSDKEILAHKCGKMKLYRVSLVLHDRVEVEIGKQDHNRGIIVYRL